MSIDFSSITIISTSCAQLLDPKNVDHAVWQELSAQFFLVFLDEKQGDYSNQSVGRWDERFQKNPGEHNNNFLERVYKQLTEKYAGLKKQHWLHISSHAHTEFRSAAIEFGVPTALVSHSPPDQPWEKLPDSHLVVSDLFQLHEALTQDKGKAVLYQVHGSFVHAKLARNFVKWMRQEHGEELLSQWGCTEFRVWSEDENPCLLHCHYLFTTKEHLDYYLTHHAPELRTKARSYFPEEMASFQRSVSTLEVSGFRRAISDFKSVPKEGQIP